MEIIVTVHHYNLDIHQFAVPRLIIGAVYKQMEEKMKVTADLKLTFHLQVWFKQKVSWGNSERDCF